MANTQPMYTPLSIETATLANFSFVVTIVGDIIEKVKEVRSFRSECSKLANTCILLSFAFLENSAHLDKIRSGKDFMKCLQQVFLLVTQCTEKWSILHIGWELAIAKKVENVTKELEACQKMFDTEVLMNVNSSSSKAVTSLLTMKSDLAAIKSSVDENISQRQEFLDHFQELGRVLDARRQEERSLTPLGSIQMSVISFPDQRLIVDNEESSPNPKSGSFEGEPVIFESICTTADRLPRLAKLYRRIGDVARVQKFYGIAEIDRAQYAIMQDLRRYQSLDQTIQDGFLKQVPPIQRLRFAYELAATMSALHHNNLLIKVLSDTTIFVEKISEDEIRPILSDLKSAREIWEVTARHSYDIRYQAPETEKAGMRSRMSDVWSLGIVLSQCFTTSYPYGARNIHVNGDEDNLRRDRIKEILREGQPAFDGHIDDEFAKALTIINGCLSRDPRQRPTASYLAQQLFDLLISESSRELKNIPDTYTPISTVADYSLLVEQLIRSAQAEKRSRKDKKGKTPSSHGKSGNKFKQSVIDELLASDRASEPSAQFAAGTAYLWGIMESEHQDDALTRKPLNIRNAERALPYLMSANEQAYKDAGEELYYAHKVLATYYYDMMNRKDE